jgi:hypothetical protein
LSRIQALIDLGVRSVGWDLSAVAQRAIDRGHLCPTFLTALAKVICDQAPAELVQDFQAPESLP